MPSKHSEKAIWMFALATLASFFASPADAADDDAAFVQAMAQGKSLEGVHRFREAMRCFQQARQLAPNRWEAYDRIGDLLVTQDDAKEAVETLTRGIALNPKGADMFFLRGKAYFELNDSKHSLADFTSAIKLEPLNPNFLDHRAHFFAATNDNQSAVKDYSAAIAITAPMKATRNSPAKPAGNNYELMLINRATVYRKMGRYQDAINDYTAALTAKKRVNIMRALRDRADCYDKLGKHDLAEADRKAAAKAEDGWIN